MDIVSLINQVEVIDSHIAENHFAGFDVYDVWDNGLFHALLRCRVKLLRKMIRFVLSWSVFLCPGVILKVSKKEKTINAKAMGLILKAYCNAYATLKDDKYLSKAESVASWLLENPSQGYSGLCWGYPFGWSSTIFIPKNTPSSVVSTVVGDGLYSLYGITKDVKYLNACKGICDFILHDLHIDRIDDDTICFSYTPMDFNHVHNANLFCSEFLIRIGKECSINEYISDGMRAANFYLREINSDGSNAYWALRDRHHSKYSRNVNDHYHTGFEIRCLCRIADVLGEDRYFDAFRKRYEYYLKEYVASPRIYMYPQKNYPLNIHAASEAILCNSMVMQMLGNKEDWIDDIVAWINKEFLDEDGLYLFEKRKLGPLTLNCKFKYLRWGQAWMFLALSEYMKLWSKCEEDYRH
ncbi:MAG: hypothetical protein WC383_15055 [Gammaproteobacteria bacterium]